MGRPAAIAVACLALGCGASPVGRQPRAGASPSAAVDAPAEELGVCRAEGAEQVSAAAEVDRIGLLIDFELGETDAIDTAVSSLQALVASSPCFALARVENPRFPNDSGRQPEDAPTLRAWWADGGEAWLRFYLGRGTMIVEGEERPATFVPPDVRRSLFDDSARQSDTDVTPLLCDRREPTCGVPTRGWVARANRALAQAESEITERYQVCASSTDYLEWRSCVEGLRGTGEALPLGRYRSPEKGWFVVQSVVGHYDYSLRVSAFHLETGTTYLGSSTTGNATDTETRVGRIVRANLREAAWMVLFAGEVERHLALQGHAVALPLGMRRRWPPGVTYDAIGDVAMVGASGLYHYAFGWYGAGLVARGELATLGHHGEAHALELLDIAETGFVAAAPAVCLPREVLVPPPNTAAHRFFERGELEAIHEGLLERSVASCPSR